MGLSSYLRKLKKIIDKRLDRYLAPDRDIPLVLNKAMRHSVLAGGKRLRSILTLELCRICGGSVDDALPVGCAIELIHSYSLVHDDLPSMDDDNYRRGKPACHMAFGEANAILCGDALIPLAFGIISRELNCTSASEIIRELSDAIGRKGMVAGQTLDMAYKNKRKSKIVIESVNSLKTARLFEASAKCGSLAASAGAVKVKAAGEFGRFLGMAYQITDDIMDGGDYVKIFGAGKSRENARKFMEKAKKSLGVFGNKANILKAIADYILKRDE